MRTGSENEHSAALCAPWRAAVVPGSMRFMLGTFAPDPAPAELAFSALRLQVALQREAAAQGVYAQLADLGPAGQPQPPSAQK